jgi:heparan-alpha-glucosaminide N-acetyltransferase
MTLLGPDLVLTDRNSLLDENADRKKKRLISLDAYRGFVMLAMAAGGLRIASVWEKHQEALVAGGQSETLWNVLSY